MNVLYQPTPLEEAYGKYLLENVFQISHWHQLPAGSATTGQPSSTSTAAAIRISGRHAVPFFTKSGVDRAVLRDVWSTIDPNNRGYLDDPSQFHASLRLIALAQTGTLQSYLMSSTSAAHSNMTVAMVECLRQTQDESHRHLPVFEGMSIPDASYLLHRYGPTTTRAGTTPTVETSAAAASFGPGPAVTMTTTTAAPAHFTFQKKLDPFANLTQTATTTTTPPSGWFASHSAPSTAPSVPHLSQHPPAPPLPVVPTVSISDAFGDLVDVDDKPLPALALAGVEPAVHAGDHRVPTAADGGDNVAAAAITDDDDDDDFGDFVDPTTTSSALAPAADPFNDVPDETAVAPVPNDAMMALSSTSVDDGDAENGVTGATDAPLVVGMPTPAAEAQAGLNDSSEFGDFCGGGGSDDMAVSAAAFTDMAAATTTGPFAVGNVFSQSAAEMSVPVSQLQSALSGGGDAAQRASSISLDLFAPAHGKARAPSLVPSNTTTPTAPASSSSILGFGVELSDAAQEFLTSQPAVVSAGDWDALDALAAVEDAPLPSLAVPEAESSPEPGEATNQVPVSDGAAAESEEDDFGDFVAIVPSGALEAAASDQPSGASPPEDESDGFGDFVGTEDVEAVPESTAKADVRAPESAESDIFSASVEELAKQPASAFPSHEASKSWDGTETVNLSIPVPLERRSSAPTPGTQGWGAFDALVVESSAAQLPSPTTQLSKILETAPGHRLSATGSFVAFDEILGVADDAPLPSLSQIASTTAIPEGTNGDDDQEGTPGEEGPDAVGPTSECTVPRVLLRTDDRLETEFYSASGSASEDSEGFQSAAESEGEVVTSDEAITEPTVFGVSTEAAIDTDDPFAALDALSSPLPELPPLSSFNAAPAAFDPAPSIDEVLQAGFTSSEIAGSGAAESHPPTIPVEASDSETFGDFESAEFDAPPPATVEKSEPLVKGDSKSTPPHFTTDPDDSFGDFASGEPVPAADVLPNVDAAPTESAPDDGFQAFAAFSMEPTIESQPAASEPATVRDTTPAVDDDDFGDFTAFSQDAPASLDVPHDTHGEPTGSSWDDFQEASVAGTGTLTVQADAHESDRDQLLAIRRQVVELSERLPESFRRQSDGQIVDFGDCFDANLGLDVPVSEERTRRTRTCLQLLERLTNQHDNHQLASTFWEQALRVARDELVAGASLLEEASKLGSTELAACRPKLEMYVHGLGEYVRISRSVVASVGDLLLLDASALFTIDTLATSWCNLAILELALGIEQRWREVERLGTHLGLASKQTAPHKLDTVEEIRQRGNESERGLKDVCDFTLQPLASGRELETKSSVQWRGHTYMACAANFLQSSCSFYVVES